MAERRFTSATPTAICWKWSHRACGASFEVLPRITDETSIALIDGFFPHKHGAPEETANPTRQARRNADVSRRAGAGLHPDCFFADGATGSFRFSSVSTEYSM